MTNLINVATECFCPISRMVPAGEASALLGLFESTVEVVWCEVHACIVRVGYMVSLAYSGPYGETEYETLAAVSTLAHARRLKATHAARSPQYAIEVVRISMGARGYFSNPEAPSSTHPEALAAHEARIEAKAKAKAEARAKAKAEAKAAPPAWGAALRAQYGL